jgi:Na+-transporting methylmalonyl-CoA/oxaloacetate decarboxylase gamma subunit
MGFIFKFLLIAIALSWIFSKLLQFFLRSKLKQFVDHANNLKREEEMRKKGRSGKGEVKVDHIPRDYQEKRAKEIKGGDYIDYEEVKD